MRFTRAWLECRNIWRLFWTSRSTILLIILVTYTGLVVIDTGRALKTSMHTSNYEEQIHKTNFIKQVSSSIPRNRLRPMDLSSPAFFVKFVADRHNTKCYPSDNQADQSIPSGTSSRGVHAEKQSNSIVSKISLITNIIGWGGDKKGEDNGIEDTSKSIVRPSANHSTEGGVSGEVQHVSRYREAIEYAVNELNITANDEAILLCQFPGFLQKFSRPIWRQAERQLRLKHSCNKFSAILQDDGGGEEDFRYNARDNFAFCSHFEDGTSDWTRVLLALGGDTASSSVPTAGDEKQLLELQLKQEQHYSTIPVRSLKHLESGLKKPTLLTLSKHPYTRIVSSYVNKIKNTSRAEFSAYWISELRNQSFLDVVTSIRANLVAKYPKLASMDTLDQLLDITAIGENKQNKIVRNSNNTGNSLTFREFVWLAMKQNLECFNNMDCLRAINPHWRPQYVRCSPCEVHSDLKAQVGTLSDDTGLLLQLLQRDDRSVTFQDNNMNSSNESNSYNNRHNIHRNRSNGIKNMNRANANSNGDGAGAAKAAHERGRLAIPKPADELHQTKETLTYINTLTFEEESILYIIYSLDFTLFGYTFENLY